MKRSDITPCQIVSQLSYRDSRQGWPVLVLSLDSYRVDYRSRELEHAGHARLVGTPAMVEQVGLLTVHLSFSMHHEPLMDVLDFRAKAERLRELASVPAAIAAINASAGKSWDDREHLYIRDADGELLGHYELLTGLQMIAGDYVELTLAERHAEVQRQSYAEQAEQERLANVVRARRQLARLAELGITGYHVSDWESPTRAAALSFEHMDQLLDWAEGYAAEVPSAFNNV
jgi:hypothetical protein